MAYPKPRPRVAALAVAMVLVAVVIVFFASRPSSKNVGQTNGQTTSQGQKNSKLSPAVNIETADFKYQQPAGWSKLSKEFLNSGGSVSGIAIAPAATVRFTIAMEPASSSPKSETELKNSTLSTLKRLQNFELISSGNTKVDGKSGQKYTYRYGDKIKTKQELSTVVYKANVFLIKFTGADSDFDKQTADFNKILSSFKFK